LSHFTLQHALCCKKGGIVIFRQNENPRRTSAHGWQKAFSLYAFSSTRQTIDSPWSRCRNSKKPCHSPTLVNNPPNKQAQTKLNTVTSHSKVLGKTYRLHTRRPHHRLSYRCQVILQTASHRSHQITREGKETQIP
jgi:hypothetical protein